jgi:hypothetical protein
VDAVVAQISRRKPVLKKLPEGETVAACEIEGAFPESVCPSPERERTPPRVTFEPAGTAQPTFAIRGQVVDLMAEGDSDQEAEK